MNSGELNHGVNSLLLHPVDPITLLIPFFTMMNFFMMPMSSLFESKPQQVNLDYLGVLQISGVDAKQFLQGQLTCDLHSLNQHQASVGAFCDYKGRMIANFWIWQRSDNDHFYLLLPQNVLSSVIQHLQKYAIFSHVQLQPMENWQVIGIVCRDDVDIANFSENILPKQIRQFSIYHDLIILRMFGQHARFFIIGPVNSFQQIQQRLCDSFETVGYSSWQMFDVLNSWVWITDKIQHQFIPQMIQLDQLHGVSFTKGCYVGQEIIARTHHLGTLKRHCYLLQMKNNNKPIIGDNLNDSQENQVGIIVNWCIHPRYELLVLAIIQDHSIQNDIFYQNQKIFIFSKNEMLN